MSKKKKQKKKHVLINNSYYTNRPKSCQVLLEQESFDHIFKEHI